MPATPATPVSSSAQRKRARRVLQACENCRRKKTRCPGERPRCSTCSRLGQGCRYPAIETFGEETPGPGQYDPRHGSGDGAAQASYIRRLEDRLARLEAKLDASLENNRQDRVDASGSPRHADSPKSPRSLGSDHNVDGPGTHIGAVIAEAIRVYFRCCHRQPVWLFEPKSRLSIKSPDAVLFCVLALSTQHSPEACNGLSPEPLPSPAEYNDAARRAILHDIGNTAVDMATMQALCLLSFSNLVCGDVQLASFHVSLLGNLMQCAGLDTHRLPDRTPLLENQRRLYWSVQMVAVLCGAPIKIPSTYDITSPSFVVPMETNATATRRYANDNQPAPLLPLDPPSIDIRRPGTAAERASPHIISIWLHMVRSASLWGLVRAYVWRCHHEQHHPPATDPSARPPWHPDADYTAIHAQLFDMEGAFPVMFRYDASRFMDRPLDELLRHRDFWLPWMKIQVTYHTIHAVLNHPFLYSPRVSQTRPGGPNSFWKTSTDLALLHSTWIARILGMAHKKGLPMSDPFFVYAASVAITLHLYWSRAADPSIRTAAEKYIIVCRSLIAELAGHWPVCRNMEHDVEQLMKLSASSRPTPAEASSSSTAQQPPASSQTSTTLADNISLIWRILDFAAFQQPGASLGQSLFRPSLRDSLQPRAASPQPMDLEDPQVESPPKDFQTSTGDYAAPPDWFTPPDMPGATGATPAAVPPMELPVTTTTSEPVDVQTGHTAPTVHIDHTASHTGHAGNTMDDLSIWTTWETTQPNDAAPSMIFDPFGQLFLSRNAPDYSRWWDGGNL
ncbi:hypothetical protein SCUCBS95973_001003 [Sporothrix curviconia]|uniref:Zn(2)-C6 fungal-type domain-containing protein n=1 Tax=Sporothrix curviconia TaxID=1260050 RepID=A0ABP0AUW4_9PEZI